MSRDAVIVSTARTPIGKAYRGAFNNTYGATLSGHAVLLPHGGYNALSRFPLKDRGAPYDMVHIEGRSIAASLDKVFVDCGNAVLRTLRFSWRDASGNLVPLGENDWSAQLCFGYPTT